jgi:hypothetical protein
MSHHTPFALSLLLLLASLLRRDVCFLTFTEEIEIVKHELAEISLC